MRDPSGNSEWPAGVEAPVDETRASQLAAAAVLAQRCHYEAEHTHQVVRLALRLFDELRPLHGLGADERFWLQCGAMLHDIGWIEGQKAHHKTALRLVLSAELPLSDDERRIVALVARYHRKALPKDTHADFAALSDGRRHAVRVLGGLLRVADGLDRSHADVVEDVTCTVTPQRMVVHCRTTGWAEPERQAAQRKGNLLENALRRVLTIET